MDIVLANQYTSHQNKMPIIHSNIRSFLYTMSATWDKPVSSVIFVISRDSKHTHRIDFPQPVGIIDAVLEVERFLSAPLDDAYWEQIKDGQWLDRTYCEIRGDCLGDLRFLESIREIEPGVVQLECGS